jgi:putative DNA-invertase from lambdoid prophage Rac
MPIVYGYGRHSTDKQGLTEDAQKDKVESHIRNNLSHLQYGGWLYDSATSGKMPLFERPEGRKLMALAQPGDHLVWAKLDRAFRSVVDGASTLAMLAHKGVYVHSLDLGLDTSTAVGRCVCTVMLAFAELEREYASERTAEALSAKKRAGLPIGAGVPVGWKKVGKGKDGRFVPDYPERVQAEAILGMRVQGMSHEAIVTALRTTRRSNGREWNRETVRRAILAADLRFPKAVTESELRSLAEPAPASRSA